MKVKDLLIELAKAMEICGDCELVIRITTRNVEGSAESVKEVPISYTLLNRSNPCIAIEASHLAFAIKELP